MPRPYETIPANSGNSISIWQRATKLSIIRARRLAADRPRAVEVIPDPMQEAPISLLAYGDGVRCAMKC